MIFKIDILNGRKVKNNLIKFRNSQDSSQFSICRVYNRLSRIKKAIPKYLAKKKITFSI
jgi:hypothetical protein